MTGMIAYFIVSWLFAAYMIYDLLNACLAKFVLGPPLMALWMWWGMVLAVLISGLVLIGGRFLKLRKD